MLSLVAATLLPASGASAGVIWEPFDLVDERTVNVWSVSLFGTGSLLNGGTLSLFEDTEARIAANALVLGTGGGEFLFSNNFDGTFLVEAIVGGILTGTKTISGPEFLLGVDWGNGYVGEASANVISADGTSYEAFYDDGQNQGISYIIDVIAIPEPPQGIPAPATYLLLGPLLLLLVRNRASFGDVK